MELEAYSAVISAFKVQGELTWKKEIILQDLRMIFKISEERHRQELKRVESTIPSYLIPNNNSSSFNPSKRTFSPSQDVDSSDESAFSEEDSKRQRISKDYRAPNDTVYTVQPFPNSDDQSVKVKASKPKVKKDGGAEKKKGGRKKKENPPNKNEIDWQLKKMEPNQVPTLNNVANKPQETDPRVHDLDLAPELVEARNAGNLDGFREALEAKKKEIQDALHQMQ